MYTSISKYFIYSLGLMGAKKIIKREKKENIPQLPSFRGVLEVIHSLNGRIRFKAPYIKGSQEKCNELKLQLNKISSISSVEINHITGSILLIYKEDIEPTLIVGIIIKLLGLEESVKGGTQSLITKEFKNINESIDLALNEKTKGFLDLKSLIFILFSIVGFRKIRKYPDLSPPGMNYLWWGYTIMNI